MLIVRQEQFETIIRGTEEDFVNYLFGYVQSNHAEAAAERDDIILREMIRGGIKRAASHQITMVEDTQNFIAKMFEIAPNFDEQAEIKVVLDEQDISADKRIEKLRSPFISDDVWEKAKSNYKETAWFAHLPEKKSAINKKSKLKGK